MINYFNFKKFGDQFLITNDIGKHIFLDSNNFKRLIKDGIDLEENLQQVLSDRGFLFHTSQTAFSEKLKYQLRDMKNYIFQSTQLHIFVVTTSCNMKCVYCQAQNGKDLPNGFMSKETAKKAVDVALQSPSKSLQFEFQGGEPLLNFKVIKYIIEYSREKAGDKEIGYSVVTNLTLLTDEILDYLEKNNIGISTSLDGSNVIHNMNRPYRTSEDTYDDVITSINKIKDRGLYVGAIQTTTRNSLSRYKEIVDAYVELGFDNISLRALTPLGCANENWKEVGYSAEEFMEFYRNAFEYLMIINRNGYRIKEGIASIFLKKIIDGVAVNYMELRSPCGAALGQIAYYYDGNVYTCDEGRMLAEMGNDAFCLGNLQTADYNVLMESKVCRGACTSSILESLPSCCDCVYQPYCGVCPVVNYALNGDIYERQPNGYRCSIYKGILDLLFEKLQECNPETENIFRSWIR